MVGHLPQGLGFSTLVSPPTIIAPSSAWTSGPFITLRAAEMVGLAIHAACTPSAPCQAVETNFSWGNLEAVTLILNMEASVHECVGVLASSGTLWGEALTISHASDGTNPSQAKAISLRTTGSALATLRNCFLTDVKETPLRCISHESTGEVSLTGVRIGDSDGSTYVKDVEITNGGVLNSMGSGFRPGGEAVKEWAPAGLVRGPAAAPADALIDLSTSAFWIDEASNELKVKVKYADGTIKEGVVCALA